MKYIIMLGVIIIGIGVGIYVAMKPQILSCESISYEMSDYDVLTRKTEITYEGDPSSKYGDVGNRKFLVNCKNMRSKEPRCTVDGSYPSDSSSISDEILIFGVADYLGGGHEALEKEGINIGSILGNSHYFRVSRIDGTFTYTKNGRAVKSVQDGSIKQSVTKRTGRCKLYEPLF
jgi:hypothetical protein